MLNIGRSNSQNIKFHRISAHSQKLSNKRTLMLILHCKNTRTCAFIHNRRVFLYTRQAIGIQAFLRYCTVFDPQPALMLQGLEIKECMKAFLFNPGSTSG